jgi:ribosomal 50S subunit-recycling heat shock protein
MSKLDWTMRIDDFLSTIGVITRRTEAKRLADAGMIEVNGRVIKPGYDVKVEDIVRIKGAHPTALQILAIPQSSVAKTARNQYIKIL